MKKFFVVLLVLAASSALLASNMGFKLVYPLTSTGSYQLNWVSLPYYWGSSATASSVCTDIGGNAYSVSHWVRSSETYEDWSCTFSSGTDFAITPGEGIVVKVTSGTNWTIVGSHNPTTAYGLTKTGILQLNWVSVPYHTTAATASGICTDVGANSYSVSHWVRSSETYEDWSCVYSSGTDFAIAPGEALAVKVSAATTWTPSHY
jgi:hypothetical protein